MVDTSMGTGRQRVLDLQGALLFRAWFDREKCPVQETFPQAAVCMLACCTIHVNFSYRVIDNRSGCVPFLLRVRLPTARLPCTAVNHSSRKIILSLAHVQ